ncbi:uncharacterized protein [Linepithema humile]
MDSINKKTLVDYNGPAIIEDLQNRNDQDFTNHIRVKRNVLMNDSIINHQWNYSMNLINSFPLVSTNFWNKSDAINLFNKGSNLNTDGRIQYSDVFYRTTISMPYLRHKRRVLSRSKRHKKHAKENTKHTKIGNKKHSTSKFSQKSIMKKANSTKKRIKKAGIEIPVKTIDESQMGSKIEKRESGHSSLRTDSSEQQNAVILPFVHTGKAELRVRIEKIPTNVSSFTVNWTDCSVGTHPYSTISPKYGAKIDKISNFNITNLEITPNFDSTEKTDEKEILLPRRDDNLMIEFTLKKSDYGSNTSNQETNNSGNRLYNSESYSTKFNSLGIKDDSKNGKYNHVNKISVELSNGNMKSRAKRNQEITSECYLRNNINTRSKQFRNAEQRTSIGNMKHKTKHRRIRGNRAVRSIGEIKELAEKLIVKVSELEIYVNDRNETLYVTDSCTSKNADRTAVERTPRIVLEKQGVSSSKTVGNIDNRQHFAKNSGQVALAGKKTFQMPSGSSRFVRGENHTRRKPRRKWSRWMDWSSCSVTCGKGRQIRWRHCLRDCNDAETEMEEKACQLPACPPGKFLGIF